MLVNVYICTACAMPCERIAKKPFKHKLGFKRLGRSDCCKAKWKVIQVDTGYSGVAEAFNV